MKYVVYNKVARGFYTGRVANDGDEEFTPNAKEAKSFSWHSGAVAWMVANFPKAAEDVYEVRTFNDLGKRGGTRRYRE